MRKQGLGIHPLVGMVLLVVASAADAAQPDYLTHEKPTADSAKEIAEPIDEGFEAKSYDEPSFFPRWKERLESLPPFWRDTNLNLHVRSYYLDRTSSGGRKNEAWAVGGWLRYDSGWWQERLKLGAAIYTSQKVYAPDGRDGTLLLEPGQEGFSVLGEAFLDAYLSDAARLRLYRQTFDLPYLNKQDSRMVPNTFEAYVLGTKSLPRLAYIAGYVTKMKKRDSTEFVSMSEAAGLDGDEGLGMLGARYAFSEDFTIGAIDYYVRDFMNTVYTEANATWELTHDLDMRLSGQYTHQKSVDDELAGEFRTSVVGGKVALGYRAAVLSLAFSSTDEESGIRSPFGGYPGYLSLILKDFDRADEDAWLLGLSYDFKRIGIPGLTGFVNYAQGDTPESGPAASPDQEELDLTLDYRFKNKTLTGLWIRLRGAFVNQSGPGAQDTNDYRIIINYDIPII